MTESVTMPAPESTATAARLGPDTAPPPAAAPPRAIFWKPRRKPPYLIAAIVLLAIIAIIAIFEAWDLPPLSGATIRTDDAYVRGRTTIVAPQVSGYVVQVAVTDYAQVKEGQLLVAIDDRVYSARVDQARASLAAQRAALANNLQARAARRAALNGQAASLANAHAQLVKAKADLARVDDLVRDGSVSIRERDQTVAALEQAQAQVHQSEATQDIARQDVRTVEVAKDALHAQVEAAQAALKLAEIDLEHAKILAPRAGQVGEVAVRLGQYVTNGTQLLAVVPPDRWVIANFKEAQTAHMQAGQPARIRVDALGGAQYKGHIETLSPAAGSEFALLKPDNATGNFVKVPQRIGVRILIDASDAELQKLRPGISVEARIDTSQAPR